MPVLMVVTRNATIKVFSQGQDRRWQDFKRDIENIASPAELLSHASMCADKFVDNAKKDEGTPKH